MSNDSKKADGQGGITHAMLTCAIEEIATDASATDTWNGVTGGAVGSPVATPVNARKVPAGVKTSITNTKTGSPMILEQFILRVFE